jgi:hypothetical protein
LIEYLEELHDHGRATVDHTTLLLNCYAKLKDTSKLDSFIKAPGELKFDLETAIAMCRQGGYYEQAAYLATKHGENDMVVDILIEDSKKYAEAVEYIWRLDPEVVCLDCAIWKEQANNSCQAYHNLMKYARVLLTHCPERTSELFKVYYSGQYRPRTEVEQPSEPQEQTTSTVQSLAALLPLRYMNVGTGTQPPAEVPEPAANEDKLEDSPPDYDIPKPRTAFSAFVDHPKEFIDFLETLVQQPDLKKDAKVDLFTTLFEMYLDTAKGKKDAGERQEWETKAKKLIEGKDVSYPVAYLSPLILNSYRSQSPHPTCFSSPTCQISEKDPPSSASKKVSASTFSVPSLQQRIHKAPSKRYAATGLMSPSSTLTH